MSTQKTDTFNNSCDVACLKFMLPCDKTTSHLRTIHFFEGSSITPIWCTEFCISQSVAVTLFTFGGQVYKRWRENHSGFCRGATTFSKLGVQCLGVGYCRPTEQNTDGIPSFVHCSLLRNGNHTLLQKVGVVRPNFGGPDPPTGVGPLGFCINSTQIGWFSVDLLKM